MDKQRCTCGTAFGKRDLVESSETSCECAPLDRVEIKYAFLFANVSQIFYILSPLRYCMDAARYLRDKLTAAGFSCRLNDLSSTVVLERPASDAFIKRWQLACEEDIAHVVVMPNQTISGRAGSIQHMPRLIDLFPSYVTWNENMDGQNLFIEHHRSRCFPTRPGARSPLPRRKDCVKA